MEYQDIQNIDIHNESCFMSNEDSLFLNSSILNGKSSLSDDNWNNRKVFRSKNKRRSEYVHLMNSNTQDYYIKGIFKSELSEDDDSELDDCDFSEDFSEVLVKFNINKSNQIKTKESIKMRVQRLKITTNQKEDRKSIKDDDSELDDCDFSEDDLAELMQNKDKVRKLKCLDRGAGKGLFKSSNF